MGENKIVEHGTPVGEQQPYKMVVCQENVEDELRCWCNAKLGDFPVACPTQGRALNHPASSARAQTWKRSVMISRRGGFRMVSPPYPSPHPS